MVIADLSAGGAQRVFTRIANAWADEGRNISVVTLSDPNDDFFQLSPRIRRLGIGDLLPSDGLLRAIAANLRRLWSLRRAVRESGAARVLSFTGAMNVQTVLATRGLGVRVCISERNDPNRQSLGRVWDILRRWTYPMADLVTANSHGALATLARFVAAEKLVFLPNPVDVPRSTAVAPISGQVILNIGRLTPQKGQDVLLDAFANIAGVHGDWRLAIVGTGECEDALRGQAARLGISDWVSFKGQVDDPFPFYRAAQIFVLPSRFEGTPNALLEAMSVSLPCIVSDASGGPLEFVEDGASGLVVAAGDAGQLSAALTRLIEDPDLRSALGTAGCERLRLNSMATVLKIWAEALDLPPVSGVTNVQ